MKVVLLQDVPNVGSAGTIQVVSDGYARNYLFPKGLAEMATPGRINDAEQRIRAEDRRIEREEQALQSIADQFEGLQLSIVARVGSQGRLYGSITAQDIAEELSRRLGHDIDRRKVRLEEPIRTIGQHQVTVHLVGRLHPNVTVVVIGAEPEETTPETEDDTSNTGHGASVEATDGLRTTSKEQPAS
jgi:large subunit ribosomal protein L9